VSVTVVRHEFPTFDAAQRNELLHSAAVQAVERLEESPKGFDQAFLLTLTEAESRCAVDSLAGNAPTWRAWVAAMQVGTAMFASATTAEQSVAARISGSIRTIPASGTAHCVNAGNWIKAFWLSVICREQGRMTDLCNVPISLLRESGAEYDEYIYAWVDVLQSYWLNAGNVGDKLVAAVNGTDPDRAEIADRNLMLKILYPPLDLFTQYLRQDHERFNAVLAEVIQWHKEYWSEEQDRASSSEGLVALGPLAIACLAYDAGFPIDVDSDYLPKALLEGAWVGEFNT
jgi:hypothetical protein